MLNELAQIEKPKIELALPFKWLTFQDANKKKLNLLGSGFASAFFFATPELSGAHGQGLGTATCCLV